MLKITLLFILDWGDLLKTAGERTIELLLAISKRLSSRKNCRQVEYLVCIGMNDDSVGRQRRIQEYGDVSDIILFFTFWEE